MRLNTAYRLMAWIIAASMASLTHGAASIKSAQAVALDNTYYVATTGSDSNPGTEGQPWRTILFAIRQLHPGDTVLVRGGTYTEGVGTRNDHRRGTPSQRITVAAYPDERPVLRGFLRIYDPDYWTFDGIDVTWDPETGTPNLPMVAIVDGRGWAFQNAEVWGAHSYTAVRVLSETPGLPADWRLTGNCIHSTHRVSTAGERTQHNLYVTNGLDPQGPGLVERNILFGAHNGFNIKLGGGTPTTDQAARVVVRNNTMYDAQQNATVVWGSRDIVLERNLMLRGPSGKPEYTNIRGFENTGSGNLARFNSGADSAGVVGNYQSPTGVVAGAGNRFPVPPQFDNVASCSGFRPHAAEARAYGARSIVDRFAGSDRIDTAVRLSRAAFTDPSAVDTVVVATSRSYPDALAGAPLAGAVGGPMLLTPADRLDDRVRAEVQRLGAETAILLGGTAALGNQVEADLRAAGVGNVRRLAGGNRFETAARIASEVGGTEALVVEGLNADPRRGWPDAVAVSALAARTRTPILLVERDRLPPETGQALRDLGTDRVDVVGGPAAVSDAVLAELRDPAGDGTQQVDVERISGPDRYSTSALVVDATVASGGDARHLWLATGLNWPDALAAGPAVAATGGILLLVHGHDLRDSPATVSWVADRVGTFAAIHLIGGLAAIGDSVQDGIAHAARS